MLRKLLLTALLAVFLALPAIALAGGSDQPQQKIQRPPISHLVPEHHDGGISSEVLAALIAGGLGLCGVVITTVVTLQNRGSRGTRRK